MEEFHMKTFGLPIFAYIIVVWSLSCVWLFATHGLQHTRLPCPSISWRLFKLMSIELVMPFNHLILCCPHSPPAFSLPQHQGFFQWVGFSSQPKYWNFSFSISPSNAYSGLICFRIDGFDLLAVQGTLRSLLQHSSKASVLWHLAFFMAQFSHPYMTTGKKNHTFDYTDLCQTSDISAF